MSNFITFLLIREECLKAGHCFKGGCEMQRGDRYYKCVYHFKDFPHA